MGNTLGLVGWWTFDGKDVSSGAIRDLSGNGNHGSAVNIASTTFYARGQIGQAGNFDGGDDVITVSSSNSINNLGPVTISAWVYANSAGEVNLGRIYQKGNDNGTIIMYTSGGIRFTRGFSTSGITRTTSNGSLILRTWNHILVTWDGSTSASNVHIYINGVEPSYQTTTDGVGTVLDDIAQGGMRVGSNVGLTTSWDGLIDDVRVYNRVLSAAEVKALYTQGEGRTLTTVKGPTNGLVGHWTFDGKDISNGRIIDKSGNGNHGTPTNIASTTFYTRGQIGQAGNFDGTDDVVVTPSDSLGTGALSITAWIKTNGSQLSSNKLISNGETRIEGIDATSNRLRFSSNGTTFINTASQAITPGVWKFISVTRNASGILNFYVDGALSGSADLDGGTPDVGTGNTNIGASVTGNTTFGGRIDDVRIYNRALSASEILQIYNEASAKFNVSSHVGDGGGLARGLVGHWTFDGKDISNGRIIDKSGNGNHGTPTNIASTTFYARGQIGQAGNFDGVDDQIATNSNFISTNPVTITAWVYARSLGESNVGRIVGNGNGTLFRVQTTSCGSGCFTLTSNGGLNEASSGSGTLALNQWLFVVASRDASGTANMYINGVLSGTANQNSGTPATGNTNVIIGNSSTGSATWDGYIDDVRIYNRVLSASEIKQLYNAGR